MTDGLPPIDAALLPAAVRTGSPERRQAYQAALSFERVLLGQMTQQLTKSLGGSESSAATQELARTLPTTLADALIASGGIGLATQLDAAWQQQAGASTTEGASA